MCMVLLQVVHLHCIASRAMSSTPRSEVQSTSGSDVRPLQRRRQRAAGHAPRPARVRPGGLDQAAGHVHCGTVSCHLCAFPPTWCNRGRSSSRSTGGSCLTCGLAQTGAGAGSYEQDIGILTVNTGSAPDLPYTAPLARAGAGHNELMTHSMPHAMTHGPILQPAHLLVKHHLERLLKRRCRGSCCRPLVRPRQPACSCQKPLCISRRAAGRAAEIRSWRRRPWTGPTTVRVTLGCERR